MKLIKIDKNSKYLKEIENIYLNSFPDNERINFNEIVNNTFPNSQLLGIVEENKLLGFTYISLFKNFVYLIYFAIEKTERNKNYGSKALKKIDKMFKNKSKILSVEVPSAKNGIQMKRINFYEKNGFSLADFQFDWNEQLLCIMFKEKFDKNIFLDFLLANFPTCKNFKPLKLEF